MSIALHCTMPSSSAARIDRLQRRAAQEVDVLCLGGGLPDPRLFPRQDLSDAFVRALHRPAAALQYGWPEGELELRHWVAARLRAAGADLQAKDVVITSGAQQAISLTARALFSPAMMIGLTGESYPGAIDMFRAWGLNIVPWQRAASGFYVMPTVANPGGQAMASDVRAELLRRAEVEGATIIEDDAYGDTRFSDTRTRPLIADAPERVVHVGTLSKVLCPGVRIGWLATRHPGFSSILAEKQQADLQAPSLNQHIVAEYLSDGRFERHIARVRRVYEQKARLLERAVRRSLPMFRLRAPQGGFSLWLEHEDEQTPVSDMTLLAAAIRHGVSFDPGRSFRIRESQRLALRLCYGSVPEGDIDEGVERLAEALDYVRTRDVGNAVRRASKLHWARSSAERQKRSEP